MQICILYYTIIYAYIKYAAIKGQNVLPNFRKILRDKRLNEKEEEHQQDRRQKNLMVFGASESKKVTDEEFIKDLIKDVWS